MTRLGQVLRSEYASVIKEPVPDALLALLQPGQDPGRSS
ncbi:NepR family anti-sigma factor [Microvirga sp. Mcv34]